MGREATIITGIALFVDVENLVAGSFTAGLKIDLEPVIAQLKELGPVRLRRAYGDLTKIVESANRGERAHAELKEIRRMMQRNIFEIMDIPFLTAHKNACDMHLALDALSLAFTNEGISHYAILSSDRDYVPLFSRLRELGKSVIAIAVDPQMTNTSSLREGSDHLLYYSEIVRPVAMPPYQEDAQIELEPALLDQYNDLLFRAISALERQGKKLVGTEVSQMMARLESDFDPKRVGCLNFKSLVLRLQKERGLKVSFPSGAGDMVFFGPEAPPPSTPPLPLPVMTSRLPTPSPLDIQWLRDAVEGALKLPLPPSDRRHRILETLHESYKNRIKEGPMQLTELTEHANGKLRPMGIDDATVFKLGLSLYFARCFQCQPGTLPSNPIIVGLARPVEDWELCILTNFVRGIIRTTRRTPTKDEIGEFFFGREAKKNYDLCSRVLGNATE